MSIPQQMVGHPVVRARAAGCGAWLLLLLVTAGCGELHFVPSPYTPQQIELIYSAQEHLTVVRWRVSSNAPVAETRFEMLGTDGYHPIDFSKSVYPGGVIACGDKRGACAQYVVRGKYEVDRNARPIQAVHDVYGFLPGGVATTKTVSETLTMESFFHTGNDVVFIHVTDAVAEAGPYKFGRTYERTMWPTTGLCIPGTAPDDLEFSPLDAASGFPPPTPLTTAGMYCVATRPVPADGGEAAVVQTRVATLPEVVTKTHVFEPEIERSPIIYQVILDLEIPVQDRCEEVIQEIEDLLGRYMTSPGVAVHKLPTINLAQAQDGSSRCAQNNGRTVAAAQMAQTVKELVETLPGTHHQYHFMYFNNLDAPPPNPLVTSIQSLFDALFVPTGEDVELLTHSWLFAPVGGTVSSLTWWAVWIWQTVDENFGPALEEYKRNSLPYTTQLHDPTEPVLLLSPEETTAQEGSWIKICSSSPNARPSSQLPFQHQITDPSWQIASADPPAYTVELPNSRVVKGGEFVPASSIVNYQICTRYCDGHPYVTTIGTGEISWKDSRSCARLDP